MATAAQAITRPTSTIAKPATTLQWFGQFLREELAPYSGREALVTRAVVAATIMMILTMVFRMPYGPYAALFAVTISRENPETTVKEVRTIIVAFTVCVLYILAGAMFFLGDQDLRLFWIIATLFLMFYALRVVTNHTAAVRFGYLTIVTIPLWDEHITAERRVEGTLWAFGAISLASMITAVAEIVYAEVRGRDELLQSIGERLATVEELLHCYIDGRDVDSKTEEQIAKLAMIGTSRLRRFLQRSSYSPRYAEQIGAVVALSGRLVDIAANLTVLRLDLRDDDREHLRKVAASLASIRAALLMGRAPKPLETSAHSYGVPLLHELEATVSIISAVFTGSQTLITHASRPERGDPPSRFLVADAFSNPEHIKFALKACLAASICYLIYNAKDWPGLNTSITTCFLTALSTIGSSRQKQMLRVAGATIGVVLGIGSQIFILPYLDSIAGFTLLFLAVTIPATWIATSGPRLSYCGAQILTAFYLINLNEFTVQTSLEPGRDRVIGIFLGLLMMWLVFDQLWGAPAVVEMKKHFVSNFRLLAQFAREPISRDLRVDIERSYALREKINNNFAAVRASADGVVLEFGPTRGQDLAWRERIIRWQNQLRVLFLTRIALWKYRARLPGFDIPESALAAQRDFEYESAKVLDSIADRLDGKPPGQTAHLEEAFDRLLDTLQTYDSEQPQKVQTPQQQTLLQLCSRCKGLVSSLSEQIWPPETVGESAVVTIRGN